MLLAAVVLAAGVAALSPGGSGVLTTAQARVAYGVGDESPATFSDPRFAWLGIKLVRLVVPYDVALHRDELGAARAWLTAARAHGLRPLIEFSRSDVRPRLLPSVGAYRSAVLAFRRLFPWVHDLGTWDEENFTGQPTARDPRRAAQYFNGLSALCRSCTIMAADILDQPQMARWVKAFLRYARHPRIFGLHNYYDINHGGHLRTSQFLRLVPGDVWFAETGGLVWRWNTITHQFIVRGEGRATRAARHLRALAKLSPRIKRIYYYHWRVRTTLTQARRRPGTVTWDSGLVRPDCSPRPALSVLAATLGRNPARIPRAVLNGFGTCSAPPLPPLTGV